MKPKIRAAASPADEADADAVPSRKRPRREQQRAIETRKVILDAALTEFAAKGFESANTRVIAQRAGIQPALVAYHYRTKEILWRAVAEHYLTEMRETWDQRAPVDSNLSAKEKVREEFRALFWMMMKHQDFYHFMLRENTPESPRLPWLAETILAPMVGRVLPQIRLAQEAGEFPPIEPVLFHYMTIGIASVLTALAREIFLIAGISINDPGVAESYLEMAESVIFDRGSEHYSSRPCSVELTASPVGENRDENDASGLSYIEELRAENARLKRLLVESLLDKEKQKESDRLRSRDLYSPRNYITQNPD